MIMNTKSKISPEEYSSILKSLEIENIFLSESSFKVFDCSKNGGTIDLAFKDKYSFSEAGGEKAFFIASFKMDGSLGKEEDKETLFKMSGEFKIECRKENNVTISKEFFEVFRDTSLVVFVWPYYREFIQNTLVRAGFPSLTLPMRILGK